jgi:transposase
VDSVTVVPMDIHKKFSVATPMGEDGRACAKLKVEHSDKGKMLEFFLQFPEGTSVIMEATFNWPWIADMAREAGLEPHLAHPPRVREMARGMSKSDRKDALFLGRLWLAGGDVFPESYLAPPEVRENRSLMRTRLLLVKMRTQLKNNIHGQLHRCGILLDGENGVSDLFGTRGRRILKKIDLPASERLMLERKLSVLDDLERHIELLEREIEKDLQDDARAEVLDSIPGIGPILAYTILAEMGEIERFANGRALAAYSGVLPLNNESGGKDFGKRTSKRSNKFLRLAALEAVTGAVRKSRRMKSLHSRVKAKNRKKPGKARVAVAREIMELVYLLLTRNECYSEKRPPRPGSRGSAVKAKRGKKKSHRPHRASQVFLCARSVNQSQAEK